MPVAFWAGERCFAAVRASWLQQLHVKVWSWGQQLEGKSEQARGEIRRRFLEQCGAKQTSRGVSLCSLPTSTYCSAAPAAKSVVQRALQCRFLSVGSRVQNKFPVTISPGIIVVVVMVVVVVVVIVIVVDAAAPAHLLTQYYLLLIRLVVFCDPSQHSVFCT